MRNAIKVILVVSVIGFSIFLIQRSCHEGGPLHDPDQPGSIGGVALSRREEAPRQGITAKPYTRTEKELQDRRDFLKGIDSQESAKDSTANAGRVEEAAGREQVQGNWVLVDPNSTTLELTVVGDTGSLKTYRSESQKEAGVEQKVRVLALDKSIFVLSDETSNPPLIMLRFSFDAGGSARVIRLDSQNKTVSLKVISHTR